jgi:hypothetical protein
VAGIEGGVGAPSGMTHGACQRKQRAVNLRQQQTYNSGKVIATLKLIRKRNLAFPKMGC